jgi:hypothetical protein
VVERIEYGAEVKRRGKEEKRRRGEEEKKRAAN